MNEKLLHELMGRLDVLDRNAVRLRIGQVTATSPLTVSVGGSATPQAGAHSLTALSVGNRVAILVSGNDMLVLGVIL